VQRPLRSSGRMHVQHTALRAIRAGGLVLARPNHEALISPPTVSPTFCVLSPAILDVRYAVNSIRTTTTFCASPRRGTVPRTVAHRPRCASVVCRRMQAERVPVPVRLRHRNLPSGDPKIPAASSSDHVMDPSAINGAAAVEQ
jgi:hypothetical protein